MKELAGHMFSGIRFRPALGTYRSAIENNLISLLNHPELVELFIDFELNFSNYLINQNTDHEATISGEAMHISRRLGSMSVLYDEYDFQPPDPHKLSSQEYRQVIAQKDVYAYFVLIYKTQINQQDRLQDIKETTLDILSVLSEL